jgi:hypothetical protein
LKKFALLATVGLILFAGIVYGGGKYADVKPFLKKEAKKRLIEAMADLIEAPEKPIKEKKEH